MNQGILFYSNNEIPLMQFAVASYTLFPKYDGCIHIVFGPNTPQFIIDILNKQDRISYSMAKKRYVSNKKSGSSKDEWREKAYIISEESPFDTTLYYDCDHCFFNNLNISVFDDIRNSGLVTAMGMRHPKRHDKVLKHFNLAGDKLDKYYKVNGGCVGYQKNYNGMKIWLDKMHQYMHNKNSHILRKNSEEFALGYTINSGFGGRIDEKYSVCLNKNETKKDFSETDNIGVHFVRGRWMHSASWKKMFLEAYQTNFFNLKNNFDQYSKCYVDYGLSLLKRD